MKEIQISDKKIKLVPKKTQIKSVKYAVSDLTFLTQKV